MGDAVLQADNDPTSLQPNGPGNGRSKTYGQRAF